jgi:hypothetical protein
MKMVCLRNNGQNLEERTNWEVGIGDNKETCGKKKLCAERLK